MTIIQEYVGRAGDWVPFVAGQVISPRGGQFQTEPIGVAPAVSGTVVSHTRIDWAWSAVSGADEYETAADGAAWVSRGLTRNLIDDNLSPGQTRTLAVRGRNAAGPGPSGIATRTTTASAEAIQLGIHVTAAELAAWQTRASNGPYRSTGDVRTNSPGDWNRIVAYKNTFKSETYTAIWSDPGYTQGMTTDGGKFVQPAKMMCGAFYNLLFPGDTILVNKLKSVIVQQARTPGADFDSFAPGGGDAHQSVAGLVTQFIHAFDYLEVRAQLDNVGSYFTAAERTDVLDWFFSAGRYMRRVVDRSLDQLWSARNGDVDNYTYIHSDSEGEPLYYLANGTAPNRAWTAARFYNNRRASIIAMVSAAGFLLKRLNYTSNSYDTPQLFINQSVLFCKEMIAFGLYPDGSISDFWRGVASGANTSGAGHELGLAYTAANLGVCTIVADGAAREGDTSLWTFETSAGRRGTQGTPSGETGKSIRFAQKAMGRYLTDAYERFGHTTRTADYRIDGRRPRDGSGWHGVTHLAYACNGYHNDVFVESYMDRSAAGMALWPASPAPSGPREAGQSYMGVDSTFPGMAFMFVGMAAVDPYGAS